MLTDYIMFQKEILIAPKANAKTPSGVIGKPFAGGVFIFTDMKMIILRKGIKHEVLFDDEDFVLIDQYKWYIDQDGYVVGYRKDLPTTHKKWVKLHRLILGIINDSKIQVDHIHHNLLDNRKSEIRKCTKSENARNITSRGTSKYLGVHIGRTITRRKGGKVYIYYRPMASIRINGKKKKLGNFKTEEAAAIAYDNAARIYHGEFANLNFK